MEETALVRARDEDRAPCYCLLCFQLLAHKTVFLFEAVTVLALLTIVVLRAAFIACLREIIRVVVALQLVVENVS